MYQTKLIVLVAFVFALSLGCATTERYERMLNSWLGLHTEQLVSSWGQPTELQTSPDGNRVYVYERTRKLYEPADKPPGYRECITYFEVDQKGVIVKWKYRGNNCVAK